jgi:hypothetical protein
MASASTSSATLRVLENGALKTGTPARVAAARSTWLVPMQKQPTAISRRAAARAAASSWVRERMPSMCTSASAAARSSPCRAWPSAVTLS